MRNRAFWEESRKYLQQENPQHTTAGFQPRQWILSRLAIFWRFPTVLFLRTVEPMLWEWNIYLWQVEMGHSWIINKTSEDRNQSPGPSAREAQL